MTAFDIIGDIHGRFDLFEALMKALGYQARGCGYVPPAGRQAVFVGDLIDRGPGQVRLLAAVRDMIDSGHARAVMGNHEFNAIAYVTPDPAQRGHECLRPNRADTPKSAQNRRQHAAFLAQVGEGSRAHGEWVDWFRALPLHLDLGGIRVAHAWWDADAAALVNAPAHRDNRGRLTDVFMEESHRRGSVLMHARKVLTTGHEQDLPPGCCITDKEGNQHGNVRLKVWKHEARHLRDLAIIPGGDTRVLPDLTVDQVLPGGIREVTGSPIFLGHYWYSGRVQLESTKVAVLDWSAAHSGPLVAYRWDGEAHLSNDKLVAVNA